MHYRHGLISLVILALGLAACGGSRAGQDNPDRTVTPATAGATEAAEGGSPVPVFTGMPPQTNAAQIQPPERREELSRLSNLLQFQVTGLNGLAVGKVSDFIINTCETYIIYFVVDPASDLRLADGSRLVIPFEVVTINSGALDADAKSIALYLAFEHLSSAPVFADPLALFPLTWEATVRTYWLEVARVGKLDTSCNAGGTTMVHKIAYASQLLGAELKDGNHNLLGTVTEAILEPESGKLGFYVVNLVNNGGLVLVPLGKTNIPEEALQPGMTIELILLTENNILTNAPRLGSLEEAANGASQNTARQYWGP